MVRVIHRHKGVSNASLLYQGGKPTYQTTYSEVEREVAGSTNSSFKALGFHSTTIDALCFIVGHTRGCESGFAAYNLLHV